MIVLDAATNGRKRRDGVVEVQMERERCGIRITDGVVREREGWLGCR